MGQPLDSRKLESPFPKDAVHQINLVEISSVVLEKSVIVVDKCMCDISAMK